MGSVLGSFEKVPGTLTLSVLTTAGIAIGIAVVTGGLPGDSVHGVLVALVGGLLGAVVLTTQRWSQRQTRIEEMEDDLEQVMRQFDGITYTDDDPAGELLTAAEEGTIQEAEATGREIVVKRDIGFDVPERLTSGQAVPGWTDARMLVDLLEGTYDGPLSERDATKRLLDDIYQRDLIVDWADDGDSAALTADRSPAHLDAYEKRVQRLASDLKGIPREGVGLHELVVQPWLETVEALREERERANELDDELSATQQRLETVETERDRLEKRQKATKRAAYETYRVASPEGQTVPDSTEEILVSLRKAFESGAVGRRTAVDAATAVGQTESVDTETGRQLLTTLASTDTDQSTVETALREVLAALDGYQQQSRKLELASTDTDRLESQIATVRTDVEDLSPWLRDLFETRLDRETRQLETDPDALGRSHIQQRLSVLEDLVADLDDEPGSVDDVEAYRKEVANRYEAFMDQYISGDAGAEYNNKLPNHFANVVDNLLAEAAQKHQQGANDEAVGLVSAAEQLLGYIEKLYEKRVLRKQLRDLERIRSG